MKKGRIKRTTKKKTIVLIIGILLVIIDQAMKFLSVDKSLVLIPSFVDINYSQSDTIIFGLFDIDLFAAMTITFVILGFITKLMIYYFNKRKFLHSTSLIFILSGGFSNLLDRILKGYVVDYIDITLFNFSISLADFLIVFGIVIFVILLLIDLIYPERKRRKKRKAKLMKKKEKQEEKMDKKIEEKDISKDKNKRNN